MTQYIKNIEYFKNAGFTKKDELQEIAAVANYLSVPARTQLFDYGDYGDHYYILLDGLVDLIIPMEKEKVDPDKVGEEPEVLFKRESTFRLNRRQATLVEKKQRKSMWNKMNTLGLRAMDNINDTNGNKNEEFE